MAVNGISNMINNKFRLSGLSSGLDTDQIIKDLMKVEKLPLNKVMQKKQLAEWKRDSYRDVTNLLRGLKDEFFNVLKPSSNMLSQTNYKKFTASSSDGTVVTAAGGASATSGVHKLTVTNLAEASTLISSDTVTKALESSDIITTGAASDVVSSSGKKIKVTLDGIKKEITLGNFTDTSTVADLAADIQNKIASEFGAGKVIVSATGAGSDKLTFSTSGGASKIVLEDASTNNGLGNLNFTSGSSNRISTTDTLNTLRNKLKTSFDFKLDADNSQNVVLTINSKEFKFSKDTTLSSMLNTINSDSTAKVNLTYDEASDKFIVKAKQTGSGNEIKMSEDTSTLFAGIGLKSFKGSSAAALSYTNEKFSVSIDGELKEFTLNGDYLDRDSLALDIQNKIRSGFSGKMVTVNANTDNTLSFSIDNTGSVLSISTQDPETSALGLKNANYTLGEDARITLDGQDITRSSNTVTANGVTYTLLKESATEQTVSLNLNTDGIFDNIKKFVDKYNDVVQTLNGKLTEKYDRDYQPLTDEEKESMSEDDIKKWETKAKTGILRNDGNLQNIVYNMRKALFDDISGVKTKLTSIGIDTGSYSDKGKLFIDEEKLKAAIQNDPDGVMNLFGKQSESYTNFSRAYTSEQRKTRYGEEGLAYRISDILEDNISSIRDSAGRKGTLLQIAGITGDMSEFSNTIYDEIDDYNKKISDLQVKLYTKEDNYYKKFAQLEKVMGQMNSQSSWLSSQLGTSAQ